MARSARKRGLGESRSGRFVAQPVASRRRAADAPDKSLVDAFVARTGRALADIAARMPRQRLAAAVGAPTDTDVLFRSLHEAAAIANEIVPARDPLTAALLRGAEQKRAMLSAEGGFLSAPQLAAHLGVTPQAIGKRRARGQVFWLEAGDGYAYPAFQIGPAGLLPGIREVLDAFQVEEPWMRVHFMLTRDRRLRGRRPIDVLRAGDVAAVTRAAAAYGEHGAA
jgi:hypothetical protein